MKTRKKKVDISNFKIELRYTQDSTKAETERFRRLIQLIFPHLSSTKDYGVDKFLEKIERKGKYSINKSTLLKRITFLCF